MNVATPHTRYMLCMASLLTLSVSVSVSVSLFLSLS